MKPKFIKMFKQLTLGILSLALTTGPAIALDDWDWKEIPYDKISTHIVKNNHSLWVATNGGGVYCYNTNTKNYQHFTRVNDGLADNFIYDMRINANNDVWVATVNGLSKFNNDTWQTSTKENSPLKSHFITALAVDPIDDALWIGTYDTGLYRFDGATWQHYEIPDLQADYAFVTSIEVSQNGEVWLGVWGEGVYRFYNNEWTRYDPGNSPLSSYFIYVKAIDATGTVWLHSSNDFYPEAISLNAFNPSSNDWQRYLVGVTIHSVYSDTNGVVWAQSENTLFKKQDAAFVPVKSLTSQMNRSFPNQRLLHGDTTHPLIAGTDQGFLIKDTHNSWVEHLPPGLADMTIHDLVIDASNTKWFASANGLHKMNQDNQISVYTPANSPLPSAKINGLALDKKNVLWIATHAGLVKWDGSIWHIINTENSDLMTNNLSDVAVDNKGHVWVSFSIYSSGVQRFDGKDWQHFSAEDGLSSNAITKIHTIKNQIWLQSPQGISIYNGRSWKTLTTADGLLSNNITSMDLHPHYAWIGSDKGLMKYDGRYFEYITDGLPQLHVGAIYENPQGNLYVATHNGGLSLRTKGNQWTHQNWDDGLTNAYINQIVPDKNQHLWLGTQFAVGITKPTI